MYEQNNESLIVHTAEQKLGSNLDGFLLGNVLFFRTYLAHFSDPNLCLGTGFVRIA